MKIALLQILPTGSLNGNREKGMEACRKAKVLGADIALFPEMWSNGYDIPEDAEARSARRSGGREFCLRIRKTGGGTQHGDRHHVSGKDRETAKKCGQPVWTATAAAVHLRQGAYL